MTYILDTNVISYFLQAQRETELSDAANFFPLAIVDEVRKELENDPTRGGKSFRKWLDSSNIKVQSISVGSASSYTLIDLIPKSKGGESIVKGLGERASIALAAHDASLVFVTHDKNAAWMGLRELWMQGERVLRFAVFLHRLWTERAIVDPSVLEDVMKAAHQTDEPWPTWWPGWFSTIKTKTSIATVTTQLPA
ncbi:MAG TPA: hypothetical protein PK156_13840 [Polyangium sp.]|nr:hypothetical protein [Polyangium sp.]